MSSQNFDGYSTIQARVPGTVNLSHAARPQGRLDFIRTEFRARSKCHRVAPL